MTSVRSYFNDRANAMQVCTSGITYWFSYQTCVAFEDGDGLRVVKNQWGPTTGKHLNLIDGGSREAVKERLKLDEFNRQLAQAEAAHKEM